MGEQRTFASAAWATKKRVTKREQFLTEMNAVIPCAELEAVIAPLALANLYRLRSELGAAGATCLEEHKQLRRSRNGLLVPDANRREQHHTRPRGPRISQNTTLAEVP